MISAHDAKELRKKAVTVDFSEVEKRIRHAAENGDESIQYHFNSRTQKAKSELIKQLRKLGYSVKEESRYDPRDNWSWDYIIISW